jgi:heptosyltransferase II
MKPARPPLIVRLRNWVGDVVLSVPTLERLHQAGFDLHLIGKRWAADLLAGHGWPVHTLADGFGPRVAQLRELKAVVQQSVRDRRHTINALCFPYSFSSALEMRLAGLNALGYAREGRSLLLKRAETLHKPQHELEVYWQLGSALMHQPMPAPAHIALKLSSAHLELAWKLRREHGIEPGYLVICPFAGGTYDKLPKTWPEFAKFAADDLPTLKRQVLILPGPGEEAIAKESFPGAHMLTGVGLGAYAALLRDAAAMISNDTGPGHLAAAVGTPVLSVLGPTVPELWGAWGANVRVLRRWPGWPDRERALGVLQDMLEHRVSTG